MTLDVQSLPGAPRLKLTTWSSLGAADELSHCLRRALLAGGAADKSHDPLIRLEARCASSRAPLAAPVVRSHIDEPSGRAVRSRRERAVRAFAVRDDLEGTERAFRSAAQAAD